MTTAASDAAKTLLFPLSVAGVRASLRVKPRASLGLFEFGSMVRFATLFLITAVCSTTSAKNEFGFSGTSFDGTAVVVSAESPEQIHVVCFLGAECPMARAYGSRLNELTGDFKDRGVQIIGVNSNRQDSPADVREYAASLKLEFPVIKDRDNVIADRFGATRTPEVFVLDSDLNVKYHGRIDDQYSPGTIRHAALRNDLKIAIEEMLAGKPVSTPITEATGCLIGKVKRGSGDLVDNDITYSQHVVPVLQKHCLECHRAGEIGPFAMNSYDEVAGWADTMLETIDNGRMPPWHADPKFGRFANARNMPESDRQIVRDWIAGGLKQGDQTTVPEAAQFSDGWQLSQEPDQIVEMRNRPFVVPSDGVVEYQYFVADPGFKEDKWITSAQVMPGARSVVHHAIVFVRPPDGSRFRGVGWLSAYVPGQRMVPLPEGRARKVPAGSKLVFQMHYTPNGIETPDTTRVGILFAEDEQVTDEVFTLIGLNQEFEIPPNTADHTVSATVPWLPDNGELLAITPHMHYRGTAFQLFTDKTDNPLLSVPSYDFNWQHSYVLDEPVPLANLDELRFSATFDNSESNPFNPDASEWITWGDQTWEEMAVAFFEVSEPRKVLADTKKTASNRRKGGGDQQKIQAYIDRCLQKMDLNQDGVIKRDEAPIVVRFFNFRSIDKNKDDVITRDELKKRATAIYK